MEYAESILKLVREVDQRPIHVEVERIKSQYHIDHYYINKNGKHIGLVKIFQGNYFYLGLEDYIDENEYIPILQLIENNVGGWRIDRIEATLHEQYREAAEEMGYFVDFSRIKMVLDLKDAKALDTDFSSIERTYARGDLTHLIDMASDAYRDSVDEQIGVFSGGMATSAISSILKGSYGEFRADMTPIIVEEGTQYIEGASMTTISEGEPFVVLIGVRRAEQGKGLGRKLLSWVIQKSIENNYEKLRLWVTVGNEKAFDLYSSVGFKEVTRIHSLYRPL